ncbi:MAG: glycosyltransferase family 39 protein [Bacteroidia bacterium]|nr:glycosyltransferase family 39 protein [Bacteroidia bacterium]
MKQFFKNNADNIILGFILVIALFLRTFKLTEIPFMHDEFSALFRTQFNSFSELIEKGVLIDTHPPLIQIVLFYFVKIFGFSEAWLKLPFIIAGVFSVFLAYKIAEDWFGKTSAVAIASLIAYLQYPIFYSQIIRPYSSGLFFILLFVYFWNKIIFYSDKKRYPNLIGFVVAGALCAYNHHFTFLQAAIIGITGIFFLNRKNIIYYFAAGLAIALLYIPNIGIFKAQLEMGGIEDWLAKPGYDFLINYFSYIVHYSWITALIIIAVFISGLFVKPFLNNKRKSLLFISLLWFIIPFLIGFIYSRYVNAVLQYSVLIFAFPFILFGIFGWMKSNSIKLRAIIAFVLAIGCISSLVHKRKHFQIFYNSPYEQIVKQAKIESDSIGLKNCLIVFSMTAKDSTRTPSKILKHYSEKYIDQEKINYLKVEDAGDYKMLVHQLESFKGDYIYYGYLAGAPVEAYPLIKQFFPYVYKTSNFYGGSYVIFSKKRTNELTNDLYKSENSFEGANTNWGNINSALLDSVALSGKFSYRFDSISEWGPGFSDTLFKIANKQMDYIDVSINVMPLNDFSDAQLVSSIQQDTIIVDWRSSQFSNFVMTPLKWNTVTLSIKLPDLDFKNTNPVINIYVWNNKKQNFLIDDFKINVRKGNPILYWIVSEEVKTK